MGMGWKKGERMARTKLSDSEIAAELAKLPG